MTIDSVSVRGEVGSRKVSSLAVGLSRLFMGLPMLLLILIAFRYITNPTHAAAPTGVALTTPEALTDTRIVGALALTIVFALASCFVSLRRLRMGHAIVMALMFLIFTVRMFGFTEDGTTLAMGAQKVKTVGEVVFLLLNAVGYVLQTYLVKPTLEQP